MTQDQESPTGSQSSKIANSYDGWAHVHQLGGYKVFYCAAVHHFTGEVEMLDIYVHRSDAVTRAMMWNEGKSAG